YLPAGPAAEQRVLDLAQLERGDCSGAADRAAGAGDIEADRPRQRLPGRHHVDLRPRLGGCAPPEGPRNDQATGYDSSRKPRLQGERFSMKRRSYGRDAGLSLRMLLTTSLLGLLYVVFAVVLFQVLNVGLIPMLVIVVGLAFFQYYTSDKLALRASGAKIVE